MDRPASLIRSLFSGVLAGAVATTLMSGVMLIGQRSGLFGEQPPRRITDRMLDRISPLAARDKRHELSVVAHYGYGLSVGAAFGLLRRLLPDVPAKLSGVVYGLAVYLVSYVGWLPILRFMPPPNRDMPARQPALIGAHIVYGLTLGLLTRGLRRRLAS